MPEKQPGQYNSKARGWFRSNNVAPRKGPFGGKDTTPAKDAPHSGSHTGRRGNLPQGSSAS